MTRLSPKAKAAKATKVAKRALKRSARPKPAQVRKPKTAERLSIDAIEAERTKGRLARHAETKKRNTDAQHLPKNKRRKPRRDPGSPSDIELLEADKKDFFESIDAPLIRVCASCGELANSVDAVLRLYDPHSDFFSPLRNTEGEVEIIPEGLVAPDCDEGKQSLWLCGRCYRSILSRKTPKFCRSSGFCIGMVPAELAVLNRMEVRLIGLGISFTTCVNLYRDGQEFTRGNAINYWNEPGNVVRELPRPLNACGVVFLTSKSDGSTSYFRVRPDLVRRALVWLITNNPLYKHVHISEENLQALDDFNINQDMPTIHVTDEEVEELRGSVHQPTREQNHAPSDSSGTSTSGSTSAFSTSPVEPTDSDVSVPDEIHTTHDSDSEANIVDQDVLDNLTESFEVEANSGSQESELERIMSAAGLEASHSQIPIGELRRQQFPIDEYNTKQLMQCCFPSLFPDGRGGYHPFDASEERLHEYSLTEYCAHLMKWHDRRFVIHGNFKFFCLNLIQRRQIDGLVRRISVTDSQMAAIALTARGRGHTHEETNEEEELRAAVHVLDSLKPFFRVVRGSGLYWSNTRDDLMSMIGNRVLPTRWPTFFLTLSAADTIWPDFARACNPALTLEECRKLPFNERRRYLNENPDISSRHFNRRFQSFFNTILCGRSKPLGEIIDHFWRVEFQQRGSPHIHCLLWVKDAPDVLKLSETEEGRVELADFVDKHISVLSKTLQDLDSCMCPTCSVPKASETDILALRPPAVGKEDWACDLSRLVQRVQQHECYANSSCRKKSAECRFGFPKSLQPKTVIETSVSADGTPSLQVHLKRDVSTINNYSPHLLSCWRANMDLQLIGNSYGAAEYAGAYVSKAEPDTLRFRRVIAKAVQRCDSNLPYHSILKRVANATLSVREVGAPEAIYILLRSLPMHSKSRTVRKVKIMRHHLRYYRVEPHSLNDLVAMADMTNEEALRIEPIERAYMNRPTCDLFDNMSLATFAEGFEETDSIGPKCSSADVWERIDGEGYIKRRVKAVVVQKSPWIRPDMSNPNFCFSEVFLYVPWRSLDELPTSDDECISRFCQAQELELDTELLQESNAKLLRQYQLDLLKQSHTASILTSLPPSEYVFVSNSNETIQGLEPMNVSEPPNDQREGVEWNNRHAYPSELIDKARNFLNACLKPWVKEKRASRSLGSQFRNIENEGSRYHYPIPGNEDMQNKEIEMAESQWIPFALAMQQSRTRLRSSLEKSDCCPLQLIINGEGGSGKSWLIRHIVKDVHNVFGEHSVTRRTSKRVLLLAHQGTAAFNIKGMTLCSAFGFTSFSKSAFSIPYQSLTETKAGPAKLKRMQQQFKDVHLVVIDEFSMI